MTVNKETEQAHEARRNGPARLQSGKARYYLSIRVPNYHWGKRIS